MGRRCDLPGRRARQWILDLKFWILWYGRGRRKHGRCRGDVKEARFSLLDIVSYNALLKGYASSGDLTAALAAV